MDYILSLELDEALSQIEYAFAQAEEELLFQRWIHDIHLQMSFDEFKAKLKPQPIRKEEEILEEVKDILALF
jgi:hypothetical protein